MSKKNNSKVKDPQDFRRLFLNFAMAISREAEVPLSELLPTYTQATIARPMAKGLLASKEAASILGLSERTLANWRTQGRGPKFQKLGSRVGYLRTDLKKYLKANEYANTSQYKA